MLLVGVALLIGYGIGYRHARRQRLASLGHVLERRLAGRSADGALLAAQIQAEVDGRPHPCKPDSFAATDEPVEAPAAYLGSDPT